MLSRVRGVRCLVFLHQEGGNERVFLGAASPEKIRWPLARKYPWLERAYLKVYAKQVWELWEYDERQAVCDSWALPPYRAEALMNQFIDELQQSAPGTPAVAVLPAAVAAPGPVWPPLTLSTDTSHWSQLRNLKWECAAWIEKGLLRKLFHASLEEQSIYEAPDESPTDKALAVLRRKDAFVAIVKQDGRFSALIDREALVKKIVSQYAVAKLRS
jgi:hypothetical protein